MQYLFEQTGLWRRSLAATDHLHQHELERPRTALLSMRANASQLVKFIPEDCKGLTVHDVTHLDALWEMADLIAGDEFTLNPVEAFVFGAAVLIHDAGMSAASYSGGIADLIRTTEWRDTATAVYRRAGVRDVSPTLLDNPAEEFRQEIIFSVLRAVHAKHAEELMSTTWRSPDGKLEVRLLDDLDLRNAFGQIIGRIAHSHHWDIERVATELRTRTGSAADLPNTWTLNEIKVACLLRCADAAHIDHRRAPSMLYALTRPIGISKAHWNFQNKLKKPTRNGERLVYNEASDFDLSEAASWWLCYDTIKMIDDELSDSHALLQDIGETPFTIRRVLGAESPRVLARQIGCAGWFPVDAEIRVSDPVNLARMLGGRNLYGRSALPPIRELLQNAADAVRARRTFEDREPTWGKIRLISEKADDGIWIHIDDDGIGMSERVLVGSLLDFGKSFWNSSLLREEFPGLEAKGINHIGKFGIGFFSVFQLGNHVKVISRKFDAAVSDTRVLEFLSINTRPIVRATKPGELPRDFSTRVSVKLENNNILNDSEHYSLPGRRRLSLRENLIVLVSTLDIECQIVDESREIFVHDPHWAALDAGTFLSAFLASAHERSYRTFDESVLISTHEHLLSDLRDEYGIIYGRAAICMLDDPGAEYVSVGGFASSSSNILSFPYIGVISGTNYDVSRQIAEPDVPRDVIVKWATRQGQLIERARFSPGELMRACYHIVSAGGDPGDLPYCIIGKTFTPYAECRKRIEELKSIDLLVSNTLYFHFELIGLESLPPLYLLQHPCEDIFILNEQRYVKLIDETTGKKLLDQGSLEVSMDDLNLSGYSKMFITLCEQIWGNLLKLKIRRRTIFLDDYYSGPGSSWVLSISGSETAP